MTIDIGKRGGSVGSALDSVGPEWASYVDSSYAATPVTIGTTRTQLVCDKDSVTENGLVGPALWDSSANVMRPRAVGEAYIIRLNLEAERLTTGNDELIVELDIGGSVGVIYRTTSTVSLSGVRSHSFEIPVFCLSTFVANGGALYLTTQGGDFEISGLSLFIIKLR